MDIYIEGSGKSINSIYREQFLKVDEEIIELEKRTESKANLFIGIILKL